MSKNLISDDRRLALFVERAIELNNTRMIREWKGYKFKLNLDTVKGGSITTDEPNEDDLRSFLLTFRMFISQQEPIYFFNVLSIVSKRLREENQNAKDFFANARKEWKIAEQGLDEIVVNGQNMTPIYVMDLYINGKYFHNDAENINKLKQLEKIELEFVKKVFFITLVNYTNVILTVANNIGYGLKNDWFDFSDISY